MEKNKFKWIKEEDIKTETDRYYDIRHDVVKLTYIPDGIEVTFDSTRGQVYAYNRALELLKEKICEKVKKCVEQNFVDLFEEE